MGQYSENATFDMMICRWHDKYVTRNPYEDEEEQEEEEPEDA